MSPRPRALSLPLWFLHSLSLHFFHLLRTKSFKKQFWGANYMASSLFYAPTCSSTPPNRPAIVIGNSVAGRVVRINGVSGTAKTARLQTLEVKATENNPSTKMTSIVCSDCEGNGAKQCSQCKGSGVNLEDHFNGRFKAGGLCWLCRGKRDILCGNCNGAGFKGGFMSDGDG